MSANPVLRRAIATGVAVSAGAVGLTGGLIALVATAGVPTTPASSTQQPQPANGGVQQPAQQDGGTLQRGDDSGSDDGGGFVQAPPGQQIPVGGSNGS